MTWSGTCVPPGPSKNASGERSAEKRARTASMSNAIVAIGRRLPGGSGRTPAATRLPHLGLDRRSVHAPRVARRHGERGCDEAVALRLREQLGETVGWRRRLDLDLDPGPDLDETVAAVRVPLRDDAVRP